MRKKLMRILALVLTLTMVFDASLVTALAADPVTVTMPETITAPEALQDGDYFFLSESEYVIGEKSSEKLYIPIGRTGDLRQEAQITLKLVDMTSHFGVNYEAEILNEDVEGFARYGHVSMVDCMAENSDNQEEFYDASDDELAELVNQQGGADLTIGDTTVGRVNTEPTDAAAGTEESGSDAAPAGDQQVEGAETEPAAEVQALTDTGNPLKDGRNQFTGVPSDRDGQPSEAEQAAAAPAEAELQGDASGEGLGEEPEAATLEDNFPGTEYTLTFAPQEQVKYLVITPKYSDKAEGDSILILSLQNPTSDVLLEENTSIANVLIQDQDEPEPVVLSMASDSLVVSGDTATIEVTRTGGINNMVYATIYTVADSAQTGRDFSGMNAKLYFPFGITKRTIELPVGHSGEDRSFSVWLTEPMGCELGQASTTIHLTAKPAEEEAELQSEDAVLQDEIETDYSGAYGGTKELAEAFGNEYVVDAAIDLSNATKFNQATVSGTTATLSGVGEDNDVKNEVYVPVESGYLYDGVRVDWEQDYSGFWGVSNGSAYICGNGSDAGRNEDATFKRVDDLFYQYERSVSNVTIGNVTTSGYGRVAKVNSVKYIKRDFTIKLEPAATPAEGGLTFANCSDAEIASYQTAIIDNSANPQKKTIRSLDSISIKANSANEYVRLAGIEAKDSFGQWYRIITFNGASRTINFTADSDTIYQLGSHSCIEWTSQSHNDNENIPYDGYSWPKSYAGTITIRPVFEYIDAKVTVNPGAAGNFLNNFTDGTRPASGQITATTTLKNIHMGDKLYLNSEAAAAGKTPLGYDMVKRDDNGTLTWSGTPEFIQETQSDGQIKRFGYLLVDSKQLTLTPVFTDRKNPVKVAIPADMVGQIKSLTDASGKAVSLRDGTLDSAGNYVYTLSSNIMSLDQIVTLKAEAKDPSHVLLWRETGSTTVYSGSTFYYQARAKAEQNVLTLTVDTSGGQYYSLSGTATAQVMNLATGRAKGTEPAESAAITADGIYTSSDSTGAFTMNPVYGKAGTKVRFLTEFNGAVGVHEATLSGSSTGAAKHWYTENKNMMSEDVRAVRVNLGSVELPAFSERSAHVTSVAVYQDSHLVSGGETIAMSGAVTKIVITTKDAEGYTDYNGNKVAPEQVTKIGLVFVDPLTGSPRSADSEYAQCVQGAPPSGAGLSGNTKIYYQRGADGYTTWTLTFSQGTFTPDNNGFTYGDILYVALETDKVIGSHYEGKIDAETGAESGSFVNETMSYNPMSTGYTVTASDDVQAQELQLPEMNSLLSAQNFTNGTTTEASYADFPFLGAIQLGLKTFFILRDIYKTVGGEDTALMNMMYNLDDSMESVADSEHESDLGSVGGLHSSPSASLMYADESGDSSQAELQADSLFKRLYNKTSGKGAPARVDVVIKLKELPYGGVRMLIGAGVTAGMDVGKDSSNWTSGANGYQNAVTAKDMLGKDFHWKNFKRSEVKSYNKIFNGASLTVSLMVGVAMDWTNINITKKDAAGNVTASNTNIYLTGVGAFVGGAVCFNATLGGALGPVPCYCGLKVYGTASGHFMDNGDLKENLEYAKQDAGDDGDKQSWIFLDNSWSWTADFYASIYAGGYVGVGFYGCLGIRADVGVELDFGKSPRIQRFFTGVSDNFGVNTLLKVSGTIDLFLASIPLGEYSQPLAEWGFYEYFNEVKKANRLLRYLDDNLAEGWIDSNTGYSNPQQSPHYDLVMGQRNMLYDLVEGNSATPAEIQNAADSLRSVAYIFGFISSWQKLRSSTSASAGVGGVSLMSEDSGYFIREAVDSQWVANDEDAALMSTYGETPGSEKTIMTNAYAQPESKLMDIGGGRMLMVFLNSNPDNGTNFQTELAYAIYDGETWSEPVPVPGGTKGAMTPSLCDAGDDVVISWAALGAEDLEDAALKSTTDVTKLLNQMEIYTVRYNKSSGMVRDSFTRLTNDGYYDNSPNAVYDEETRDVITLYTKTAPDTDYDSSSLPSDSQLLGLTNPYGVTVDAEGNLVDSKTYSVICYMSYNASTADDEQAGTTTGWQFDNYFSNELTADDFNTQRAKDNWDALSAAEQAKYSGYSTGSNSYLQALFANYTKTWRGQRFLPSVTNDQNDPPIADLTVCSGYNGLAAYAYTVDLDNNITTTDDRELFIQFYNFADHKTYVPIRLTDGGAVREDGTAIGDGLYQGQPQLIRNDKNTWLFFTEDTDGDSNNRDLMYLNISDMLKGTYRADGTLDADTLAIAPDSTLNGSGTFKIQPMEVDFSGYADDGTVAGIDSYQVFTDADDNLYILWLSPSKEEADYESERDDSTTGVEVFATAKVKESSVQQNADGTGGAVSAWSKPVQLTHTSRKNDGVTAAVTEDDGLFLVYNQYEMFDPETEESSVSQVDLMSNKLTKQGSLEVAEFQLSDETPQPGDTITVTAILENTGLTAVQGFQLESYAEDKDGNPVQSTFQARDEAGNSINLAPFTSDEVIPVNSTKAFTFQWTVPGASPAKGQTASQADLDALEGMTIVCKATEKHGTESFDPIISRSEPFTVTSQPIVMIDSVEQRSDRFYVTYTIGNVGNTTTPADMKANITLSGLYRKTQSAMEDALGVSIDAVLRSIDVGGLKPNTKQSFGKYIDIPASIFDVCGYDELKVSLTSGEDTLFTSEGVEVIETEPIHVQVNGGNRIYLTPGSTKTLTCTADGNQNNWLFDPAADVVYSSSNPNVATVTTEQDADGYKSYVTAVGTGTAKITAAIPPYSTTASVYVTVSNDERVAVVAPENGSVTVSATDSAGEATTTPDQGETVTVTAVPAEGYAVGQVIVKDADGNRILVDITAAGYTFDMPESNVTVQVVFQQGTGGFVDVAAEAYYAEPVAWAVVNGITDGTGNNRFTPDGNCTRAQMVTFLWRAAGCPTPKSQKNSFTDVKPEAYYADAVLWAVENGITNGTGDDKFSPDKTCSRSEAVTFLYRAQGSPNVRTNNGFRDVEPNTWYTRAVDWALETGITYGTGNNQFSPEQDCSRSQSVTFLYRCLSK